MTTSLNHSLAEAEYFLQQTLNILDGQITLTLDMLGVSETSDAHLFEMIEKMHAADAVLRRNIAGVKAARVIHRAREKE